MIIKILNFLFDFLKSGHKIDLHTRFSAKKEVVSRKSHKLSEMHCNIGKNLIFALVVDIEGCFYDSRRLCQISIWALELAYRVLFLKRLLTCL